MASYQTSVMLLNCFILLDQRRQFRYQARNAEDFSVVTDKMIGEILDMKDIPGRYISLLNLFEKELGKILFCTCLYYRDTCMYQI